MAVTLNPFGNMESVWKKNVGISQLYVDTIYRGNSAMGAPYVADIADVHEYVKDFNDLETDDFATVGTGTPTIATTDAKGGVLSIATQPTVPALNDEVYYSSLRELFLFDNPGKIWFEARVKLTEANVDDANIVVGLSNNVGAGLLIDGSGGILATGVDGALFFKRGNTTVWQYVTSNNTPIATDTDIGDFDDATWTKLGFVYVPGNSTTGTIIYGLNNVRAGAHEITLTGLEEMHVVFGVKTGGANLETLLVDYVRVIQER